MKDTEIIKADELISRLHKYCFVFQMKTGENCGFTEEDFAFLHDFINRQKAEIERLESDVEIWKDIAHRETRYVEIILTEAIKEFAERLKEKAYTNNYCQEVVLSEDIDNLVKEMTEGNENE